MALPTLPTIKINGPFWNADAELLRLAVPSRAWAFRELFLDLATRDYTASKVLLPGTLGLLCWVRTVRITPTSGSSPVYTFSRKSSETAPPETLSIADIKRLVLDGTVALLLVQADPAQWKGGDPTRLGTVQCTAGHIALDPLRGETISRSAFFRALDVIEASPGDRPGAALLPGGLSVHASGVTLFGQAKLPWEVNRVTAPFQLSRVVPDPVPVLSGPVRSYRLAIETERLTPSEQSAIAAAWTRLATAVDAGNPTLGLKNPSAPRWVTLEVANPRSIPRMYWLAQPWQATPQSLPLHVEREELNLVLSDQAPSDSALPATTLARTVLDDVVISRAQPVASGPAQITLKVTAARLGASGSVAGQLAYQASPETSGWRERFTLSGVQAAYDPTEAPRIVREALHLSAPSWAPGAAAAPLDSPVLWAFVPLEDGWAQLPVPNLTEQMYLDAQLSREPVASNALFAGAVAWGNDKPGTLAALPEEQPWTLTLLDADRLSGQWTLDQSTPTAPLLLGGITLELIGPEASLNGLLWIATGTPTAADALPTLDDWVTGLRPIALHTVDASFDVLPPLAMTPIPQLSFELRTSTPSYPSALLGEWSLRFEADPTLFRTMVDAKLLPSDTFSRNLPLAWRRHRTLPMIQALPLTQSSSPPSNPIASRQLAPFELPVAQDPGTALLVPANWTFGRSSGNGAGAWPLPLLTAAPAREWSALADLPVAAVSLPGLVLDPCAAGKTAMPADTGTGLAQQYRYDLPYTDEVNGLAQLPKIPRNPGEVSPVPTSPPPPPPAPLSRETLAEHWRRLSECSSLAAADAVAATGLVSGQAQLQSMVEPLAWPVDLKLSTDAYPGSLALANTGSAPRASTLLEGEAALMGITGAFSEDPGQLLHLEPEPAPGAYQVVAGSMAARANGDGTFRDQRGLDRGATIAGTRLLRTPVRLAGDSTAFELTSLLEAVPLRIGPPDTGQGATWHLWFRDLPCAGGNFDRALTRSSLAQDVNDPEAGSRGLDHLNGWEWRLSPGDSERWMLFGLEFFPLTLERATLVGEEVRHLELVGRLQLPVQNGAELDALANAIRLTFDWDAAAQRLALSAVAAESPLGEWPLALSGGEAGEAPRIEWSRIALAASRDRIDLDGAVLAFELFGAVWRIPLARLGFNALPAPIDQRYIATGATASEPLPPREVALHLDPVGLAHRVSFLLGVRLSSGVAAASSRARATPLGWQLSSAPPGPLVPPGSRSAFAADVRFQILGPDAGTANWEAGALFEDMLLSIPSTGAPEEVPLLAGEQALQFRWRNYALTGASLQLFAGMTVVPEEAPGFAALSYQVVTAANDVPTLPLTSAFVEAIIRCRWGDFLQGAANTATPSLSRICGSSAGDITFGYTAEFAATKWSERYLLNGLLEVKDLVSWPLGITFDATKVQLTLPAARSSASLDHLRHTIRVLFDQHVIPPGTFETSPAPDLLFQPASGMGWQFLAAVEHQLVEVIPGAGFAAPTLRNDRRWVAVQEVRFLSPATFKADLLAFKNDSLRVQTPAGTTAPIGDATYGYLGSGLRSQLAEGTGPALDALSASTLLVEASAVHWLKEVPVTASAATALQYLPGGTQLAALSRLEDYGPTDPRDPLWLLIQMPFLGRLQDASRDALTSPWTTAPLLQIDPVLNLQRRLASSTALPPLLLALTAWAESTPVVASFASFDAAVGRTFARLEPRSLQESWFWIQTPVFEEAPSGMQSVLAALPATPARLGRPSTLGLLHDGFRRYDPPRLNPSGDLPPDDVTGGQLLWRPGHVFAIQEVSSLSPGNTPPYGWLATALHLASGLLARAPAGSTAIRHYVAATMPAMYLANNPAPSPLVVSPFLLLDYRPPPSPSETILRMVIAELLCFDAASGRLRPVATQNWESSDRAEVQRLAAAWAREIKLRLSPESPVAVLRFREMVQNVGSETVTQAILVTNYSFGLVPGSQPPAALTKRVFRLRSPASQLRFRDGRFGGDEAPKTLHAVEVAPPQANGVQPIHLCSRPQAKSAGAAWPWGIAAMRTSVQYTLGKEGVVGRVEDLDQTGVTLWWQSLQHRVEFRSGLSGAPAAGLPPLFRARPIRSLLPVLPDPPLPAVDALRHLGAGATSKIARRQPILPGALRTTLIGSRPGVFHSLRHQLMRQSAIRIDGDDAGGGPQAGKALVSGGVPAHHRAPRPVPLPPNSMETREVALQPWASWFEPNLGLLARSSPADEAFFAALGAEPAHRLLLKVVDPPRGELSPDWDGTLGVEVAMDGPDSRVEDWIVDLQINRLGRTLHYPAQEWAGGPGRYAFQLQEDSPEAKTLAAILQEMRQGEELVVTAQVTRTSGASGFRQVLTLPFRLSATAELRLPLEPFFVLFEDPEYDRLLASASKHATEVAKTLDGDQLSVHAVTLSTDRTAYDADGRISLRFDWDDDRQLFEALLSIDLLDASGVARPLDLQPDGAPNPKLLPVTSATLYQLSILELADRSGVGQLSGGQTLSLKLTIPNHQGVIEPVEVSLSVDIAIEPVTPAPPAGYALLRRQRVLDQLQVECARFAWGPPPSRIELVNPGDLRAEIVRRRAVFQWTDTARASAAIGYAIQKIARTGSTHFPVPEVIDRVGN
jgi:hypothetical protein